MVVLFLKDPEEFNLQNPLMFNVGAYLSPDSPAALRALGSSIDLFSLWIIVLLAIGVSSAARKMSFGKALTAIAAAVGAVRLPQDVAAGRGRLMYNAAEPAARRPVNAKIEV